MIMKAINLMIIFLALIFIPITSSVLKERWDKANDLKSEYERIKGIYSFVLIDQKDLENPAFCKQAQNKERCKMFDQVSKQLKHVNDQLVSLNNIEHNGDSVNVCSTLSAITSGVPGFEISCIFLEKCQKQNLWECITDSAKYQQYNIYTRIKSNGTRLYMNRISSEVLYFILAMLAAVIGRAVSSGITNDGVSLKLLEANSFLSLLIGCFGYIVALGAKYVVILPHGEFVSSQNPYSVAIIGLIFGFYSNNVLDFFPNINKKNNGDLKTKND